MTPSPPPPSPDVRPVGFVDLRSLVLRYRDGAIIGSRLAHSFDNVLTGVVGFAELSLQVAPDGSPVAEYLAEILNASQQGVQLTQQLHQFSRAVSVTEGPTQIDLLLADEAQRLKKLLPSCVQVVVEADPAGMALAIGIEPLRQVLTHLLDNAREATTKGTIEARSLAVSSEDATLAAWLAPLGPGPFAEIRIQDTGMGMTEEQCYRLENEPFYTSQPRRAGLGLATVARILHAHGGGFQLRAVPGAGCQVRVFLPLA